MSEQNRETLLSAYSAVQAKPSRLQTIVRAVAIAVPVLGAIPTATNLYYSWRHDIPFSEVAHRLEQYDLWTRNLDCKIDYKELSTAQGARVNVGACPKSGDIAIKIAAPNGQASYEWINFDKLRQPVRSAGLVDMIIGAAAAEDGHAGGARPESGVANSIRTAQAGMEVMCEARQGSEIVRVVKEGGRCYREHISPFHTRVQKREEVPCTTTCQGGGK